MLPPNRAWPAPVRSLKYRYFRLLWLGLIISSVGTWMQIVAQSLLVLRLTHNSGFALGLVSLAQALAFFLFALVGGGFADRLERRRLLLCTQSLLMLLAFAMGLLTFTGKIHVWMILIMAFFSGAILSFDQPTRAALMSSLVPKEDLLNAVSLARVKTQIKAKEIVAHRGTFKESSGRAAQETSRALRLPRRRWTAAQILATAAFRSVNFFIGFKSSKGATPAKLFQVSTKRDAGHSAVSLASSFSFENDCDSSVLACGPVCATMLFSESIVNVAMILLCRS